MNLYSKIAGALLITTILLFYVPLTLMVYLRGPGSGFGSFLTVGLFAIDSIILIGLLPFISDKTQLFKMLYYGTLILIGLVGVFYLSFSRGWSLFFLISTVVLIGVVTFCLLQLFRPRKINILLLNIFSLITMIVFFYIFTFLI